jgi:hypothetical protein
MFHRAFDIQGAITTVDVINIDDDLRLALELLFFHLSLKTAEGKEHSA